MTKKMLIDATHPEETRVVVVNGNKVEDFDFESINKRQLAGNIYLAKVTRVEPSLQAAFVDYGGNRHGFLAFPEIHPDYYQIPVADREALLAEEEREARAEAAQEEAETEKPAKRQRRGRSRAKPEEAETTAASEAPTENNRADSAAEGAAERADDEAEKKPRRRRRSNRGQSTTGSLDVIDLADEPAKAAEAPASVPKGLEIAEPDPEPDPGDNTEAAAAQAPDPASDPEPAAAMEHAAASDGPGAPDGDDPAPLDAVIGQPAEEAEPETLAEALATATPADDNLGETPDEDAEQAAVAAVGVSDVAPAMAEAEETPLPEPEPEPEAAAVADVQPTTEAAAGPSDSPAEPAAETPDSEPETDPDAPKGGKSMAEASGLDDETLTEDIAPAEAEGEASADKPKTKSRRSRRSKSGEAKSADGKSGAAKSGGRSGGGKDAAPTRAKESPAEDDETVAETPLELEIEQAGAEDPREELIRERTIKKRRYRIQDVIKMRQIMLVQVVKEERGNKGAALTTYLSLAGRYCVLMPNTARGGGISRKITNATDRKRLREVVGTLEVPRGMGLIVRTAGADRTKPEIKRDYEFLLRQWEQVRALTLKSIAPCLIYEEGSLIKRSIRDVYNKEIEQVLVEGEAGYREAKDYMKMLTPSHAKNVQQYSDAVPLFIRYQVESYLNGMFSPTVQLRSGGYIVIGITEALVAIDVNSGRSTKEGSVEDTALKTNLEAADEVARQLRLRDLAGLIVIDFIDMDEGRNNRAVEKRMKERLKADRARIQIGRISGFGLMEMSRQRLRPGMLEASTKPCPHCHGTGMIRSDDSFALSILREVEEQGVRDRFKEVVVTAPVEIANFLINQKRAHVARIEERHGLRVSVFGDPALTSPDYTLERVKGDRAGTSTPSAAGAAEAEVITAASVHAPREKEVVREAPDPVAEVEPARAASPAQPAARHADGGESDDGSKRRRRGKRGGRRRRGRGEDGEGEAVVSEAREETAVESANDGDPAQDAPEPSGAPEATHDRDAPGEPASEAPDASADAEGGAPEAAGAMETEPDKVEEPKPRAKRSRSRRGGRAKGETAEAPAEAVTADSSAETAAEDRAQAAPVAPLDGAETAPPAEISTSAGGAGAAHMSPSSEPAPDPAPADTASDEASALDEPTPAASSEDVAAVASESAGASPDADAPAESEPEAVARSSWSEPSGDPGPSKPKRRGWWSFGF